MAITAHKAGVILSLFSKGQLIDTRVFTIADLQREASDILKHFEPETKH